MKHNALALAGLVVTAALCASEQASAQGRAGMPVSPRVGGLMDVALMPAVQKELGIENDPHKVADIRKLSAAFRDELKSGVRKFRGREAVNGYETARELQAKYNVELKKILTPQQFTRLQQVNWQLSGPSALFDPEVVQALNITREQQDKLVEINFEIFKKGRSILNPQSRPASQSQEEIDAQIKVLRGERDGKIKQVLSPQQQEQFASLKGKPFDLALVRQKPAPRGGTRSGS